MSKELALVETHTSSMLPLPWHNTHRKVYEDEKAQRGSTPNPIPSKAAAPAAASAAMLIGSESLPVSLSSSSSQLTLGSGKAQQWLPPQQQPGTAAAARAKLLMGLEVGDKPGAPTRVCELVM